MVQQKWSVWKIMKITYMVWNPVILLICCKNVFTIDEQMYESIANVLMMLRSKF